MQFDTDFFLVPKSVTGSLLYSVKETGTGFLVSGTGFGTGFGIIVCHGPKNIFANLKKLHRAITKNVHTRPMHL